MVREATIEVREQIMALAQNICSARTSFRQNLSETLFVRDHIAQFFRELERAGGEVNRKSGLRRRPLQQ
jgi:hypothetical protein